MMKRKIKGRIENIYVVDNGIHKRLATNLKSRQVDLTEARKNIEDKQGKKAYLTYETEDWNPLATKLINGNKALQDRLKYNEKKRF